VYYCSLLGPAPYFWLMLVYPSMLCNGQLLFLSVMWLLSVFAIRIQNIATCLFPSWLPGLQISSVQTPLTIGNTVSIMCSTDFDVTTIEWIREGITVANSTSQSLTLLMDPVSADHHNTQYTCRVTTPYGIQEKRVNITVQSNHYVCIIKH